MQCGNLFFIVPSISIEMFSYPIIFCPRREYKHGLGRLTMCYLVLLYFVCEGYACCALGLGFHFLLSGNKVLVELLRNRWYWSLLTGFDLLIFFLYLLYVSVFPAR